MGLYKREQCFMIVAAVLFLVGAVFMLINTFGNQEWALWTGLVFAVASALLYVAIQIQHLQFKKKYTVKKRELKDVVEKETATVEADVKEV